MTRRGRASRLLLPFLLPLPVLAGKAEAAVPFDPFAAIAIDGAAGARLPAGTRLRDADGRSVLLQSLLSGRPLLLVPVYFRCPNICGVTGVMLVDALQQFSFVAARDYRVAFVSIDAAETPADAAAARDRTAARWAPAGGAGFTYLTGDPAELGALMQALGYRYRYDAAVGQFAHAAAFAVLTGDGRVSAWLTGLGWTPFDLRLALTEAGGGRIGGLAEHVLLLCYGYDPKSGHYTPLVIRGLQVMGCAGALGLAGYIGWQIRRERVAARRQAS